MGIYDDLAKLDSHRSPTAVNLPVPKQTQPTASEPAPNHAQDAAPDPAPSRTVKRVKQRTRTRGTARGQTDELPTRDEIQEFTFRLRDELKVKVQAQVPHAWQKELEEIARKLNVQKLELYRYILGEFLGKVQRKAKP